MSFALARGIFSRSGWAVTVGMILAGTLADVDTLSALFGPSTYLAWHHTYTHSLLGLLVIVALTTALSLRLGSDKAQTKLPRIVMSMAVAATAHLLLDLCQAGGVVLLWPVRSTRFAADFLPGVDPWILALLILGSALPEFFRLVTSEIGAKDKAPRGRNGAVIALTLILIYAGARFVLHSGAIAALEPHSYRGESPRKVGAFADAFSLFTWHGIVETQSLVCLLDVPVGPGAAFNPEAANCQHKPEPSAALDLAQQTVTAQTFLRTARFPKASVEKTGDGYEVLIRALEDVAEDKSGHAVAASILLNAQPRVVHEKLVWSKDLGRP